MATKKRRLTPEERHEAMSAAGKRTAAGPAGLGNLPPERAREISSMGGKAAAEKKRQNKTFKQALQWALDMPAMKGNKVISRLANQYPGLTNREAMAIAMVVETIQEQSTKAFIAVRDTIGEAPAPPIDPNRMSASGQGGELTIKIETVTPQSLQAPAQPLQPEPIFVSAAALVDVPVEEALGAEIDAKLSTADLAEDEDT